MYHHITRDDRAVIANGLRHHDSYAEIGERIGKDKSTIGREIQRNSRNGRYCVWYAERRSKERRHEAKYAERLIENDPKLAEKIERLLHPLVSPEVVAHEVGIAHETIYAWVARTRPDLTPVLPYRGKKRRRYGTKRQEKQGWTRSVRSITERVPEERNWEGDTVKGQTKTQLLTHVERQSLFVVVDLIPNGTADVVHATMNARECFANSSITYDRGSEFALWSMIERDTGAIVYFANPHHPWERGKNENTNGRLRRVFPKGFDFSTITQRDVDRVVSLMNHTKRKSLFWKTPCAVYGKCCGSD